MRMLSAWMMNPVPTAIAVPSAHPEMETALANVCRLMSSLHLAAGLSAIFDDLRLSRESLGQGLGMAVFREEAQIIQMVQRIFELVEEAKSGVASPESDLPSTNISDVHSISDAQDPVFSDEAIPRYILVDPPRSLYRYARAGSIRGKWYREHALKLGLDVDFNHLQYYLRGVSSTHSSKHSEDDAEDHA